MSARRSRVQFLKDRHQFLTHFLKALHYVMCIGGLLRLVFHTGFGTLNGKRLFLDQEVDLLYLRYILGGITPNTLRIRLLSYLLELLPLITQGALRDFQHLRHLLYGVIFF